MPRIPYGTSQSTHTLQYWKHVVNNWWSPLSLPMNVNSGWSVATTNPTTGASTVAYWLSVLGGGHPPSVLDFPGCSPIDFSFGGGTFMFVTDTQVPMQMGPFVQPEIPSSTGGLLSAWDLYRDTHEGLLIGFTLEESYYGVGLPGTNTNDWFQGISSAMAQYPQYSGLINHPSCGALLPGAMGLWQTPWVGFGGLLLGVTGNEICLRNYGLKIWQQLHLYPLTFTQDDLANGWTKCTFYIHKWIQYIVAQNYHVHDGVQGSYNGILYNSNGNINKFWMYKYLRLNSKAHFIESAKSACNCGDFILLSNVYDWLPGGITPMFPFVMDGNTYTADSFSKIIDSNYFKDPIHVLLGLISGEGTPNKKRVKKLLRTIQKNARKEQFISEKQEEILLREYIEEEDKL
tara:strand:- start:693 stop:1898 length:1206 start_codon:yes stop_codon:yes gene_type:complete